MRGKLVGQPAHLAPAHGVGLSGQRKWPHARLADTPRRQMAIQDGVDFVRTLRGLIDALRIERQGFSGCREPFKKLRDLGRRNAAGLCDRRDTAALLLRQRQRGVKSGWYGR